MKDFYSIRETGEVNAPDYYEKKRETVLETIKPICDAFGITDYDYILSESERDYPTETLFVEGAVLPCTRNSIAATVRLLVSYISGQF